MDEDKIITLSDGLWLEPSGDNLCLLRDDVGGEVIIRIEEIVPLIDALQAIRVARNIK